MLTLRFERAALASGILFAVGQVAATAFFIGAIGPADWTAGWTAYPAD